MEVLAAFDELDDGGAEAREIDAPIIEEGPEVGLLHPLLECDGCDEREHDLIRTRRRYLYVFPVDVRGAIPDIPGCYDDVEEGLFAIETVRLAARVLALQIRINLVDVLIE